MKSRLLLVMTVLALPMAAQADALFGNSMAGDRYLPRTWGVGIDYFEMSQPYQIDSLSLVDTLDTPGGPVPVDLATALLMGQDPGSLPVDNKIRHNDIKLDVWVLPFLNVFGIYGQIDGHTHVDLRALGLQIGRAHV